MRKTERDLPNVGAAAIVESEEMQTANGPLPANRIMVVPRMQNGNLDFEAAVVPSKFNYQTGAPIRDLIHAPCRIALTIEENPAMVGTTGDIDQSVLRQALINSGNYFPPELKVNPQFFTGLALVRLAGVMLETMVHYRDTHQASTDETFLMHQEQSLQALASALDDELCKAYQ